ncbi:DUF6542 domain-containing protein [Kitasatospora sp. GAS204B]|uniref:DUF6542 domain-containing protein n=1 Tax=unclassified Kitasatospora TaxID=2633591 RepID=UPI0024753EDC|nr:DUF6542 domain-containing protein [Kitasatospora sp. GAS204B]MDH6122143.1 hypothetical protein [Kitasatospora sp. GAS204B]
MAGQRASTPTSEAPDQLRPRGRARGAQLPAPRRGADTPLPDQGQAPARRAARSRAGTRTRRPNPGATVLAALGLPVIGAFTDELLGSAPGGVFTVLTVLGTAAAGWLATRAGWWWVLTAVAPVVLGCTAGAELLANRAQYANTKALATGAAKWAVHGFPVMAYALGAALLVIVLRVVLEHRQRPERQKRSRRG